MKDVNDKNVEIEEDDEEDIVTLTDEAGKDVDFYVLAELDYKDKWYIYLEPVEKSEDFQEGEIIIFELGDDESGEEIFIPITDEKLLQEVFDEFIKEMEIDGEEEVIE